MHDLSVTLWVAIAGGVASITLLLGALIWSRQASRTNQLIDDREQEPWLLRAPLFPLVLAVVTGLIAIYALILHYAFGAADFQLPDQANITSPILVAATLIAGTLTAAYAVLKLRAHLITEARGKLDASGEARAGERHRNDQEAAYSERFAEAVKLLADDRSISRIAGAHLVLAIGDEWKSIGAQQRCFDVLLSHLRGLNVEETFADEVKSRSRREEVRLITTEMLRHLSAGDESWQVTAGDFSGAVVADFDLTGICELPQLDLRGTRVLGDALIPSAASSAAPRLAGLLCEGDLDVEVDVSWEKLELTNAEVFGSASLTAAGDLKTLTNVLNAQGLVVRGDLNLSFDVFQADVVLDTANIDGRVIVGSPQLGAAFSKDGDPVSFSAAGATFQELRIRSASPGPRLELADATGSVDLSGSKFSVEVSANNLDASSGFHIRDARFDSSLVLDGASLPSRLDLDGVTLSDAAASAISSSDFALRDQLLALKTVLRPDIAFKRNPSFEWKSTTDSYRDQSPELIDELEKGLAELADSLPVDWQLRPTFAAGVMSIVSRAAAKTGASEEAEADLKRLLSDVIERARLEQEKE